MLIILNDPHGITGQQRHELDYGITLQANIERHLAGGSDCELLINGCKVDPLIDPRLDAPPSMLDRVTVVRRPAGWAEWLLVASLLLSVYAIATAPRPEDLQTANDSPNNRLTGQTNIARAYQAIPDVYGNPRVWPDLIQESVVEYNDQHQKIITEWLCVSRGRGDVTDLRYADTPIADIAGSSNDIFSPDFNGPIGPGSSQNYPENQTTTLTNVVETFAAPDVNGQELGTVTFPDALDYSATLGTNNTTTFTLRVPDSTALNNLKSLVPIGSARVFFGYRVDEGGAGLRWFDRTCTVSAFTVSAGFATFTFVAPSPAIVSTYSTQTVSARIYAGNSSSSTVGPFTLQQTCERIRFNIIFPRGLKGTVSVRVDWEAIDGSGAATAGGFHDYEFTADTYDARYYSRELLPGVGTTRFRVKFRRLTADLGNGADVAKLESLYATRFYATKTLPGVTVIRVTTRATESATGVRERKFNLRFARHVRTLSGAAITGASITASRNFGRIMAHAWCVAGNSLAELDTEALAALNAQHGETSALLRFDGTLDDADMSLGQRMQLIADTARCKVWRDGTQWTVTREQAQTAPVLQFDYRNLAGGGESQIVVDSFMPASNDGVEIEYTDETTLSSRAYARRSVAGGTVTTAAPITPLKIRLAGCATQAQAENRADLEARRLLYQRTKVSDTALSDGGLAGLGQLVRWIDPHDFAGDDGLQAGEVMTISANVITTSEPLDWKGQATGRMQFTGADGAPLGPPIVVSPFLGGAVLLSSVPSGLYVADGINAQLGSRYAFAVGLTLAETEAAGLYVVERATPGADRTVSIALANYDARMFAAD